MLPLFPLSAFILLFTLLPFSLPAATITLVADAWPPYNNPADAAERGYIVDIAEAIFTPLGHQVDYRLMPWKVALAEVRKGTFDGLIGADSEDGAGFIFPKEEAGSYQIAFYVKRGNPWRFTSTRSLEKVILGVAEGYGYNAWLYDYIQANNKEYRRVQSVGGEHPIATNINKLLAGRIDVTPATAATMRYTARQMGVLDQIEYAGSGGLGRNVYVVFSPARPQARMYADAFSTGIQRLRASGELAVILDRYGLEDWK